MSELHCVVCFKGGNILWTITIQELERKFVELIVIKLLIPRGKSFADITANP